MSRFFCECCDYKTNNRSLIESHHIVSRYENGSNNKWNRVYLCPNCHKKVYNEKVLSGNHSIKSESSIVIKGWRMSTLGRVLNYVKNGEEYFQRSKN